MESRRGFLQKFAGIVGAVGLGGVTAKEAFSQDEHPVEVNGQRIEDICTDASGEPITSEHLHDAWAYMQGKRSGKTELSYGWMVNWVQRPTNQYLKYKIEFVERNSGRGVEVETYDVKSAERLSKDLYRFNRCGVCFPSTLNGEMRVISEAYDLDLTFHCCRLISSQGRGYHYPLPEEREFYLRNFTYSPGKVASQYRVHPPSIDDSIRRATTSYPPGAIHRALRQTKETPE